MEKPTVGCKLRHQGRRRLGLCETNCLANVMGMMFLTPEEVADLTGYKLPAKQCEQLRRQGIAFYTDRAGRPKVTRAVLEGRKVADPTPSWSPAWAGSR